MIIVPKFTNNLNEFLRDSTYDCYSKIDDPLNNSDIIYPGSFNALHKGHVEIANYAQNTFQREVIFEICVQRYDKEELSLKEIKKIEFQFLSLDRKYVFTRFSSFIQKLYLFKEFLNQLKNVKRREGRYLLGIDTLERIQNPKYYLDSEKEMSRCLKIFSEHQVDFIVFPRNGISKLDVCFELKDMVQYPLSWEEIPLSSSSMIQPDFGFDIDINANNVFVPKNIKKK